MVLTFFLFVLVSHRRAHSLRMSPSLFFERRGENLSENALFLEGERDLGYGLRGFA